MRPFQEGDGGSRRRGEGNIGSQAVSISYRICVQMLAKVKMMKDQCILDVSITPSIPSPAAISFWT